MRLLEVRRSVFNNTAGSRRHGTAQLTGFCFLQVSPGDTGWDVFSLDYHVDGPIATVTRFCLCRIFALSYPRVNCSVCASGVYKGVHGPLPARF